MVLWCSWVITCQYGSSNLCLIQIRQKNDLDFSTKTHVDLGHSKFCFDEGCVELVIWVEEQGEPPDMYETQKYQQENLLLSMEFSPFFTESMQILLAKIDPFQVTRVFPTVFKPTKTDTILYGWPQPSKVDSEFGQILKLQQSSFPKIHSGLTHAESCIQMMQTHSSTCEKWYRNLNWPKISHGCQVTSRGSKCDDVVVQRTALCYKEPQSSTPVLLCTTCTTKYYSSTTLYYKELRQ